MSHSESLEGTYMPREGDAAYDPEATPTDDDYDHSQGDLFSRELSVQNDALVFKRNEIIHAHYSLSPLAHKCLSAALSCLGGAGSRREAWGDP